MPLDADLMPTRKEPASSSHLKPVLKEPASSSRTAMGVSRYAIKTLKSSMSTATMSERVTVVEWLTALPNRLPLRLLSFRWL